jgi:hypothetical protein
VEGVSVFFIEDYDGWVKAVNQPQELIMCTTVHPVMISSMGEIRFSQEKYTVSS